MNSPLSEHFTAISPYSFSLQAKDPCFPSVPAVPNGERPETARLRPRGPSLNTISALYEPQLYLGMLAKHGKMVLVGAPAEPMFLQAFQLIPGRAEAQEKRGWEC